MFNHPGANTYETPHGNIMVYPEPTTANDLGFKLTASPPLPALPHHPRGTPLTRLASIVTYPLATLLSFIRRRPADGRRAFHNAVPPILRNHLVVVTPPPESVFPTRYPLTDQVRNWLTFPDTLKTITVLRSRQVREVYIHDFDGGLVGHQYIKRGDVLFTAGAAFYVSREIGALPPYPGWIESFIALEGHTIDREMVILYVLARYVEFPITYGGREVRYDTEWGGRSEESEHQRGVGEEADGECL